MSEQEVVKIGYRLQFHVVRREAHGFYEAVFHGPGRAGFASKDMAQRAIDHLLENDAPYTSKDTYAIIPILVAEDFDPQFTLTPDDADPEPEYMQFPPIPLRSTDN